MAVFRHDCVWVGVGPRAGATAAPRRRQALGRARTTLTFRRRAERLARAAAALAAARGRGERRRAGRRERGRAKAAARRGQAAARGDAAELEYRKQHWFRKVQERRRGGLAAFNRRRRRLRRGLRRSLCFRRRRRWWRACCVCRFALHARAEPRRSTAGRAAACGYRGRPGRLRRRPGGGRRDGCPAARGPFGAVPWRLRLGAAARAAQAAEAAAACCRPLKARGATRASGPGQHRRTGPGSALARFWKPVARGGARLKRARAPPPALEARGWSRFARGTHAHGLRTQGLADKRNCPPGIHPPGKTPARTHLADCAPIRRGAAQAVGAPWRSAGGGGVRGTATLAGRPRGTRERYVGEARSVTRSWQAVPLAKQIRGLALHIAGRCIKFGTSDITDRLI